MDRIPADGGCGWENAERIKPEMRMAKINKQTNERNLSFKSLSHGWVLRVKCAFSIVGTCYSGFFHNSLNPVIPFIDVTETRSRKYIFGLFGQLSSIWDALQPSTKVLRNKPL